MLPMMIKMRIRKIPLFFPLCIFYPFITLLCPKRYKEPLFDCLREAKGLHVEIIDEDTNIKLSI